MEYNFDEIIDRRHTNSAKFDEMDALFGSDVMHLGVADMDYRSPEPILNAMQKIVKKGVFGYTILPDNYQDLVCQWMLRRYHEKIDPEGRGFVRKSSPSAFVIGRNDWILGKINHNWRITKWTSTFITRKTGFGMNCKVITICPA